MDINIKKPDLSTILEKLSFLRNNLALLVPIILVVVAGLLFIPTVLLSKSLLKKVDADSVTKGTQLRRYSEAVTSEKQAEVERAYQKNYAQDANQIELMSLQSSKRALLNYKIFPTPQDTSVLIFEDFGKSFCAGIEAMMERGGANECPTAAELGIAGQGAGTMGGRGGMDLYGGAGYGYQTPGAEGMGLPGFGNTQKIKDAICMERAASSTFYASLADVAGYDYWADYSYDSSTAEAVEDCWYWQLGYWIIEDVFDTIATCNRGSTSVFSSPVKRLNRVAFDLGAGMMMMMGRGRSDDDAAAGRPSYVPDKYTVLAPACTGRVSDEEIDIVHFNVVVVVQAKYVLSFMKELCSAKEHVFRGWSGQEPEQRFKHNPISILQSTSSTMERKGPMHSLYRYGEDGVVELNLICEYLFEKAGLKTTDEKTVIPDVVLEKLKGEDEEEQL